MGRSHHGIVQRLDVGTSGVMVIAKSERAYSVLKQAFRDRTVDKTYHALVQGHPDPRPLLLPEGWDQPPPLRRDVPAAAEEVAFSFSQERIYRDKPFAQE